jgi:hypothetical protein
MTLLRWSPKTEEVVAVVPKIEEEVVFVPKIEDFIEMVAKPISQEESSARVRYIDLEQVRDAVLQ